MRSLNTQEITAVTGGQYFGVEPSWPVTGAIVGGLCGVFVASCATSWVAFYTIVQDLHWESIVNLTGCAAIVSVPVMVAAGVIGGFCVGMIAEELNYVA